MKKQIRLLPLLIVFVNALAIFVQWNSLSDPLPAHYDLQGNASGTMPRCMLFLYIGLGAVICLIAYLIARVKRKYQTPLVIITTGICLVLLCSTFVTLTSGTMPIFMLAEPVILLIAVVAAGVCVVRLRGK